MPRTASTNSTTPGWDEEDRTYVDSVVDVPVEKQVHVPHVQKVQKAIEALQIAYIDSVVDVPVEKQVHVPHVQKVQKAIEAPQIKTLCALDCPAKQILLAFTKDR